jgi:hypothetical protein
VSVALRGAGVLVRQQLIRSLLIRYCTAFGLLVEDFTRCELNLDSGRLSHQTRESSTPFKIAHPIKKSIKTGRQIGSMSDKVHFVTSRCPVQPVEPEGMQGHFAARFRVSVNEEVFNVKIFPAS